ncbi:MAG: ParB N-terminal domain-containing protein [Mariprofundales bacterium]
MDNRPPASNRSTSIETDLHCLDLRFSAMRLQTRQMVDAMMRSIDSSGQITPVATIREGEHRYLLMDGYVRVAALRRLGCDTVRIALWDCDVASGLLRLLGAAQSHQWAAIEEARTIRTLIQQFEYSQSAIARKVGRDVSWVSRRLALIDGVGDEVLAAICQGSLSTWAASRVMAPLARAKGEHAQALIKFLTHHHLSTRELNTWNQHYQRANRSVREQMVKDPALFLAALHNKEQEKDATILAQGPEGAWFKDMRTIKAMLKRQQKSIPMLFSSPHNQEDQQPLRQALTAIKLLVDAMQQEANP